MTITMATTAQKISEMMPYTFSRRHLDAVRVGRAENRLHGVQRARADVAEYDTESAELKRAPRGAAPLRPPRRARYRPANHSVRHHAAGLRC